MGTSRSTTILVVEDDPALRRAARRVLEGRLGYSLIVVERAEEALATVDRGDHVDLVLSDLHLPGMDGLALFAQLAIRGFQGRFLLTSGSQAEDITPGHRLPEGVAFLPRPWTIDELTAAVWHALGEA
jgi:two-component system cell cycle sensor histidine kinase/response regulator CckA